MIAMSLLDGIYLELVKFGLNAALALIITVLGLYVGRVVSFWWAVRQKHRELDFTLARQLDELYGELVAVLRLWRVSVNKYGYNYENNHQRWSLLERATKAESGIEATFLTFASERALESEELELLSRFRQACQTVRESIRDGNDIEWWRQRDPKYVAFKKLAAMVARQLVAGEHWKSPSIRRMLFSNRLVTLGIPTTKAASESITKITTDTWKDSWWKGIEKYEAMTVVGR
jgi:hypothetical protein